MVLGFCPEMLYERVSGVSREKVRSPGLPDWRWRDSAFSECPRAGRIVEADHSVLDVGAGVFAVFVAP